MIHFPNHDKEFRISLPTDEKGYLGRECQNTDCKGYFKITPGTGLEEVTCCHCPYCGHQAEQDEFHTCEQVEYAKSLVFRKVDDEILNSLKSMEFNIKPKDNLGISISMKVKRERPLPIHFYREKRLETYIECSGCTLKYAVYGVFAFCPDCGLHNSLQIFGKSLELVIKMLDITVRVEPEVADRLIENALEDCVSSFDGFGREICRLHTKTPSDQTKAEKTSFQNLERAKQNVTELFGFDISSGLTSEEWKAAIRGFQKRHILSHKMGVVDDEYVRKSGDSQAVVGRKVNIMAEEVRELVRVVSKLARNVSYNLPKSERNS